MTTRRKIRILPTRRYSRSRGAPNQNGQPGAFVNQPPGNVNAQAMQPMIVNPQTGQPITISSRSAGGLPDRRRHSGRRTPGTINQPRRPTRPARSQ